MIELQKRTFANSPSFSMIGNWVNSSSPQWEKRRVTVWGQPERGELQSVLDESEFEVDGVEPFYWRCQEEG